MAFFFTVLIFYGYSEHVAQVERNVPFLKKKSDLGRS